jgi:hypothetical protein
LFVLLKPSSIEVSGDGVGNDEERSGPFMGTPVWKVVGAVERATIRGDDSWFKTPGDIVNSGEALDSMLLDKLESR